MVCHVGLGVGEVRGLQLPSETNCDKFGVFLHRDGRLVLIQAVSCFLLYWGRKWSGVRTRSFSSSIYFCL